MSDVDVTNDAAIDKPEGGAIELKLEVVAIPVSDVDRAMDFYVSKLGWRLDADFVSEDFRGVQVTPPGSKCSIHFGRGVTSAAPGSVDHIFLAVSDLEAARADLVARDLEVSEPFHLAPGEAPQPGLDPERKTYQSYASFDDPDGNRWLLQEVTTRLPGR
jgi:catechol 2,3-dioxygenase-like lactoylglutathione lyase family enzyme